MSGGQRLSFQGALRWAANDVGMRQLLLGSTPPNVDQPGHVNLLRVGFLGASSQLPARGASAMVRLGDLGTLIGPLDLPFALIGEAPFDIAVTPDAGASELNVIASCRVVSSLTDRLYATRTVRAALADVLALPQWVRGVSAVAPATFTFRDRAGAALSAVGLSGAHDRPAIASEILVNAAGAFILYY